MAEHVPTALVVVTCISLWPIILNLLLELISELLLQFLILVGHSRSIATIEAAINLGGPIFLSTFSLIIRRLFLVIDGIMFAADWLRARDDLRVLL